MPFNLYLEEVGMKFRGQIKTDSPADFEKILNSDQKIIFQLGKGKLTTDTSYFDKNMDKELVQKILSLDKLNIDIDYKKDNRILNLNNFSYESSIVHINSSFKAEVVSDSIDELKHQAVSMKISITPGSYSLYQNESIGKLKLGSLGFSVSTDLTGTDIKNITTFPFGNIDCGFTDFVFEPSEEFYNNGFFDLLSIDKEELRKKYPQYDIEKFNMGFTSEEKAVTGEFDFASNHLFSIHTALTLQPDTSKWYESIITKGEVVVSNVNSDFKEPFDNLKKSIGDALNIIFTDDDELSLTVKGKISSPEWELLNK